MIMIWSSCTPSSNKCFRKSVLMHSHLTSWCHSVQHQCHWGALWEDSEGSCHRQMLEKNGIVTACIKQCVKWSVTALSSIMTLTSVLSECISKKVAILRQNSATLRLKALAASYIIHIFVWKKRKETRDKCCKRVKYVLKASIKVSDVKIIYYICSDFFAVPIICEDQN